MLLTNVTHSVRLQQWHGFWPFHSQRLVARQSSVDVHISQCYAVELEQLLKAMKIYHLWQQQEVYTYQSLLCFNQKVSCIFAPVAKYGMLWSLQSL